MLLYLDLKDYQLLFSESPDNNNNNNNNHIEQPSPTMAQLKEKIEPGNIVIVNPLHRTDDRLILHKGKYALVTAVNQNSANIKIWDKEIKTVAIEDLESLEENVLDVKSFIKPKDLAKLMVKFSSLQEVIDYALDRLS